MIDLDGGSAALFDGLDLLDPFEVTRDHSEASKRSSPSKRFRSAAAEPPLLSRHFLDLSTGWPR